MTFDDVRQFLAKRGAYRWFLGLLLAGYAIFIGVNFAPVAAGADSGGYMISARLLSQGEWTTEIRRVPGFTPPSSWLYTPLGLQETRGDGVFRPTYPIGLPLHYALGGLIAGWHWGVLAVGVAAACASVALSYACARELGVGRPLALAGAVALAVSPVFLFPSFIPMSDTPATAWCAAAFYCLLRARRSGGGWAVAAGAAFAMAVLVRPSNVIFLPALLFACASWKNLFFTGLGGIPGAVVNALYNYVQYGDPASSGYGSVSPLFRMENVLPSLKNYAQTLSPGLPVVFVAFVAVFFLPWKTRGWLSLSLVAWALLFPAFYVAYEFTHYTWWYLRFLIPSFPGIILVAVWGADRALAAMKTNYQPVLRGAAAGVIGLVSIWSGVKLAREHHLLLLKPYQAPYVAVTSWARAHLPANAVILTLQASGSFYFYTDFPIVRWDLMDAPTFEQLKEAVARNGQPLYAALMTHEEKDAQERFPGNWTKLSDLADVAVWQYQP